MKARVLSLVLGFVISLFFCFSSTYADTVSITFSTTWALPGAIEFETPIGGAGPPIYTGIVATNSVGSSWEDTFFSLDSQVGVSQFHPSWGTLQYVYVALSGTGLYGYSYSPEIPDGGALANGASFTATTTIEQSGLGVDLEDEDSGGSPGGGGAIVTSVNYNGPASGIAGGVIGYGTIDFDVYHEISGSIFVDDDGDSLPDEGYEGSMSGIFSGVVSVIYTFTPAASPTGGPPEGTGACLSCGPLPGDADLDDNVGLSDLDIVLANWNTFVLGWNNGDFTGDGYVGLDDLDVVLGNWNAVTPPINTASFDVPEPGGACIFGLLVAAAYIRK